MAKKEKEKEKPEGRIVKKDERVTVYAKSYGKSTEKGKIEYYPEGAEIKVHPELAKKLIKAGKATEEPKS